MKALSIIASYVNLIGIALILVGSWKMIFSTKPVLQILAFNQDRLNKESRLINIVKWIFSTTNAIDKGSQSWQNVTIPGILEKALKYLIWGIILQFLSAILFLIVYSFA